MFAYVSISRLYLYLYELYMRQKMDRIVHSVQESRRSIWKFVRLERCQRCLGRLATFDRPREFNYE